MEARTGGIPSQRGKIEDNGDEPKHTRDAAAFDI